MDNYHVLFNEEGGSVQSVTVEADSIEMAETVLIERYPNAVYWEIGIPDGE